VQIRNPSLLVQQSAKFILKQLLQNKHMFGFLSCFVSRQLFDKAFSTFHAWLIKITGPKRWKNDKRIC